MVARDPLCPAYWPEDREWALDRIDLEAQAMCVEFHKSGVYVDQERRYQLEQLFTQRYKRRERRLVDIMSAAGIGANLAKAVLRGRSDSEHEDDGGAKPGSYDQLRDLLYDKWDLGIPHGMDTEDFYTDSGLPGTGDKVLRGHLASGALTETQREFIEEMRGYRREKNKVVGTMLANAALMSNSDWDGRGKCWDQDGRIHAHWSADRVANARLACSGPNLQNQGSRKGTGAIKSIYCAPPGRILIGADLDQAHLKIVANYWGIQRLRDAFDHGWDPHVMLAYDVVKSAGENYADYAGWPEGEFHFGMKPKKGSAASAVREAFKTGRYTGLYAAGVTLRGGGRYRFKPDTILNVIRATEVVSDEGVSSLPYIDYAPGMVELFHATWMEAEPEHVSAWEAEMRNFERQGWVADPIFGRRSGLLGGGKLNEVVNYPVLTAEAHVMRIAEGRLRQAFPFAFAGHGTGLTYQCHDSVAVEVPLPDYISRHDPLWKPVKGEPLPPELERWRRVVEECMTVTIPGWTYKLTAEAAVGRTLADI